jgi:hypothetical protein
MNAFDLYEAIGDVEEQYLQHSERRVSRKGRQVLVLCLTLGLLIAGMTVTVFASPTVRSWLFGVKKLQTVRMGERIAIVSGDFQYEQNSFLSVIPEAELRENPPETLETFYVPRVLAEEWIPGDPAAAELEYPDLFRQVEANRQSKNLETCLVFFAPDPAPAQDGRTRAVYHQYAASLLQSGEPLLLLELGPDSVYTARDETVADRGVCSVFIPAWSSELRSEQAQYWYFWSDGDYLYSVGFNCPPEQALLESILTGLQPVNSLRKYVKTEREGPPPVPLTRNLTPAWVPEGYALREDYAPYSFEDGYVSFFWFGPGEGTGRRGYFRLTLCTDPGEPEAQRLFWAAEAFPEFRDHTETECTVRGRPAVLYESRLAVELIWQEEDGVTVELHSEYEGRLSGTQLLQIAESLQDAPIPSIEEETP